MSTETNYAIPDDAMQGEQLYGPVLYADSPASSRSIHHRPGHGLW
jgi:hypothetical protein